MGDELRGLVLDYLRNHQVMTLATNGSEGPWAAAVFYVNENFTFYFLSSGRTRHAQNMRYSPQIAATIHEDYRDWPAIKGVQMEGVVDQLHGGQRHHAQSLYAKKYPFIQKATAEILTGLARVNWYRLAAKRLYFIDNSKGLGHRDEIPLS